MQWAKQKHVLILLFVAKLPILLAEVWFLSAKYCDSAGKIYQGLAGNTVCWQDKWLTGTYMRITMQRSKLVSFIHVYTLPGEDEQSVVKVNAIEIKFHSLVIWWSLNKLWYLTSPQKLSNTGYYKAAYQHVDIIQTPVECNPLAWLPKLRVRTSLQQSRREILCMVCTTDSGLINTLLISRQKLCCKRVVATELG